MKKESFALLGVAGLTAVAVLGWQAVVHGYAAETDYTCLLCRAVRHETRFFGGPPVSVTGEAGTPWLAVHVPPHTHEWCWSGREVTHRLFGWNSVGCGRRHGVWTVPAEVQASFMQRATAEEMEDYYAGLKSPDATVQRRTMRWVYDRVLDRK